ncbi:MAG: WD40/YVTN/BNR-like repeat-containing protein, partial [Steroidobacteraceae bacterium]
VGGGGFAPAIVFSRVEPGLAYLRTDIGGLYRWDNTARIWVPVQDAMSESTYFGIESVAPDPVNANVVYAAAGMYRWDKPGAILKSADRGASWEIFSTSFHMGGNEDGRGLGERLAVDPNEPSILYFGSRHDGLQRSTNGGKSWSEVRSFPLRGLGWQGNGPTHAGVSFVVFDAASGSRGSASREIFVGVADPGARHLFRSRDAGESWTAVAGEPPADLLPVQAQLDDRGTLYVTYSNGPGPNGIAAGAVYKLDTRSGAWTDISPDKPDAHVPGGFMGLSVDRQQPVTLVVATVDRWPDHDTIFRSTNGGKSWKSLKESSRRDVAATPFLKWGDDEASFGWWIASVALDPFDSKHLAYVTGATMYATQDLQQADRGEPLLWRPWVKGVEETAIITLTSPPEGPALLSGFGDIGGFAHENLDAAPATMFVNPVFNNTNTLDYAGRAPTVVVRSGTPRRREGDNSVSLAYSLDFGRGWTPLKAPPLKGSDKNGPFDKRFDLEGDAAIAVSADGSTFIVMTPVPLLTRDRGKTWTPVRGMPYYARAVADRADPARFYAVDYDKGLIFGSKDGGATFTALPSKGFPRDILSQRPEKAEAPWPLLATPGKA